MLQQSRQNYLQAEVQTAAPQKLQLMLVEAAIKNVLRTKKAWEEEKFDAGFETLSRAQDIVAEILSCVDKKGNPELAGKIASIYVFIFRCLAEGGMTHDPQKLDDALRILNSERETWRQVCEKFGSSGIIAAGKGGTASGTSSGVLSSGTAAGTASSDRLDLSSDSSAKVPLPAKQSGIMTASFDRPAKPGSAPQPTGKSWDV